VRKEKRLIVYLGEKKDDVISWCRGKKKSQTLEEKKDLASSSAARGRTKTGELLQRRDRDESSPS